MQIYLPVAEMTINAAMLLAMGLAVGVLSGLFGIGGGFIVTPMLIFLGVPAPIAVGTGAAQVAASSVSGSVSHWVRKTVDVKMAVILLAGGVLGAMIGVMMQSWLKAIGQLELFISSVYVILSDDRLADADQASRHCAAEPPAPAARQSPRTAAVTTTVSDCR
jgi:uncharacterized membrane protein YfcA